MDLKNIEAKAIDRLAHSEGNADPLLEPWREIVCRGALTEDFIRDVQARFPEHKII